MDREMDGRRNVFSLRNIWPDHNNKEEIPWTEKWMVGVMSFHLGIFGLIITTRKRWNIQFGVFVGLLALVYASEKINTYCAEKWKYFANENYFDSAGLFISTILSLPVIINCLIMIVMWIYSSMTTMISLKELQINKRKKVL